MGGKKSALGLIVGLLGCALTGYALFSLLATSSCEVVAAPKTCLDLDAPGVGLGGLILLPIGLVAVVIGMVIGGGQLVFAALFLSLGAGALAVGILGLGPTLPNLPWLLGGLFLAAGLILLARALRILAAPKRFP